jgi:hypothetical protein
LAGPDVTGDFSAATSTAANIAIMINFFMSASITHHEEFVVSQTIALCEDAPV